MGLQHLPNLDGLAHLAMHGEPDERDRARKRLCSLLWPEFVAYFRSIVRDRHVAEDLTQDVLLTVVEKLDDQRNPFVFRSDNAFVRWVSVVAKNRMRGHLAGARRQAESKQRLVAREREAEEAEPEKEAQMVVRLLINRALVSIQTMTTRLREAVQHVITGAPRPTDRDNVFYGRLRRAREYIRALFGAEVRALREDNRDSEADVEASSTA